MWLFGFVLTTGKLLTLSLVLQSLLRSKELVEREAGVITSDRNIHQKTIRAGEKPLVSCWAGWAGKRVVCSPLMPHQGKKEHRNNNVQLVIPSSKHPLIKMLPLNSHKCWDFSWVVGSALAPYGCTLICSWIRCGALGGNSPALILQGYHSVVCFIAFFLSLQEHGIEYCHSSLWVS